MHRRRILREVISCAPRLIFGGADRMKRRAFIALVGGAAAWSLTAHAQTQRTVGKIGFVHPVSIRPNSFTLSILRPAMGIEAMVLEIALPDGYEEAFRSLGNERRTGIVQFCRQPTLALFTTSA